MNKIRVNSGNIASIGYNVFTKILEIEFLNETVFHYHDVPSDIYNSLMNADSHEKYLAEHIEGHYPHKKVA